LKPIDAVQAAHLFSPAAESKQGHGMRQRRVLSIGSWPRHSLTWGGWAVSTAVAGLFVAFLAPAAATSDPPGDKPQLTATASAAPSTPAASAAEGDGRGDRPAASPAASAPVKAGSAALAPFHVRHPRGALAGALVVAVLAWITLMLPLGRYLISGWEAKRLDIMDGLNASARAAYFEMFCRSTDVTPATATDAFEKMYVRWYGRRYFIVPAALLGSIGLIASVAVTFTALHGLSYLKVNPLVDLPAVAAAAISGAYLWVVNDLISRARRLDFAPADVQWAVLRLVISVPMGYAFAAVASPSAGPFVAFGLGAFPLTALTSMLARLTTKRLGMDETEAQAHDDIVSLQGVNRGIAERLAFEDVTTVPQLAYCDPVRLVMRSNLTFDFVTDCMSQALAWIYFEDQLSALRAMGMRGAVEIKAQMDAFDDEDPSHQVAHDLAVTSLQKMADALHQDVKILEVTFRQIADDPFTEFLHRVWN
jgi:hypothetical protein